MQGTERVNRALLTLLATTKLAKVHFIAGQAPDNSDVCVIVRCYNEASVVGPVLGDLRRAFPIIIGVDDGSSDDSAEVMRSWGAWVVRHGRNLGAGAALQTGLKCALLQPEIQYIVCFDADGQHNVDDAVQMVKRVRAEDLDVLLGSRFLGQTIGMPHTRRLMLQGARAFERLSSGLSLTDAHNGLRVFARGFAKQIRLQNSDMAYASELVRLIAKTGCRYGEHPVTISYTDYSQAKGQKSLNSVNIAVDIWLQRLLKRG